MKALRLALACLLGTACTGDRPSAGVTTRDSSGVKLVETAGPSTAGPTWQLAAEPRLSIGVVEGEPEYQFTQITSVGRLPGGEIFIAQLNNPPQVRVFDEAGRHLRSIGRAGNGPGELSGIAWADLLGSDTIRVYDFWASRVTHFGLSGEVLREIQVQTLGGKTARQVSTSPGFSDGDILARSNLLVPPDAPKGNGRSSTFLLRVKPTGELVDSFPVTPYVDYYTAEDRNRIHPLGRMSAFLANGSSLYVATGTAYSIEVYARGRLSAIYRHAGESRPLTDEVIDTYKTAAMAGAENDDQRAAWERSFVEMPWPESLPTYSRSLLIDDEGNLWAERYFVPGDADRRWDVFGPEGAFLAVVTVPSALRVRNVTRGLVLGVWKDDLDVESVRGYELQK